MKILNIATTMAIVFTLGCSLIAIFYQQIDLYINNQLDFYLLSLLG